MFCLCVWCTQRPKGSIGSLKMELHMVVNHCVDAGNKPGSSGRVVSADNC